ncbi:hypothetical protein [uncultured Tateyamaria sp.]|uniref:hypothetical protein n=1 Tax=uncultured Tateyamaria sp. TaxID=455651 RepID=UPI002604F777|nr:hypothetical protein [uncultured Tateyamaria sp.]
MFKHAFFAAMAFAATAPTLAPAQDFERRQRYTLPAAQIGPQSFEIVEADGAGNSQMWCAAGLYARKVLGARGGTLAIETPRGPAQSTPGRRGVVFTTAPVQGAFGGVSLSVRQAGLTFSMTHAYAQCSQFPNLKLRTGPNTLVRR